MQKLRTWNVKILAVAIILLLIGSSVTALQVCKYGSEEHGCSWDPRTWPDCWWGVLIDIGNCVLIFFISLLSECILMNPDITVFKPFVNDIISLLFPIYVVAIVITGVYIIFLSTSPESRARAKLMLIRLIMGMAMVTVSLSIYELLLNLAQAIAGKLLAGWIIGGGGGGLAVMTILVVAAAIFWYISIFILPTLVVIALISLFFRYFLVCLMAVLFPLTLFFYFFEFTKNIGTNMMRFTMMAIFTQPVQALMLVIMIIGLQNVELSGGGIIALVIGIAGLIMFIAAPLMMMGLMNWIGGAVAGAGMMVAFKRPWLGAALTSVGGIGSGMGPEAFVAGGSALVLGGHYARMRYGPAGPPSRKHRITAFAMRGGKRSATWVKRRGIRGKTVGGALEWGRRNIGRKVSPMREYWFSLRGRSSALAVANLRNEKISQGLRDEFSRRGHTLSRKAEVEKIRKMDGLTYKKNTWLIKDGDISYKVKVKGKKLEIYREREFIGKIRKHGKSIFIPGYWPAKVAARAGRPASRLAVRGGKWAGRKFIGVGIAARLRTAALLGRTPRGRSILRTWDYSRRRVGRYIQRGRRVGRKIRHEVRRRVTPLAVGIDRELKLKEGARLAKRSAWMALAYRKGVAYKVGMSLFMPGYAAHLLGKGVTRGLYEGFTTARAHLAITGINNIKYRDAEKYKKLRNEMRIGGISEVEARMFLSEERVKSEADFNNLKRKAGDLIMASKLRNKHYRRFTKDFFKPFKPSKTIDDAMGRAKTYGVSDPRLRYIEGRVASSRSAVGRIDGEIKTARRLGDKARVKQLKRNREKIMDSVNRRVNNEILDSGGFSNHLRKIGKEYGLLDSEIDGINRHFIERRHNEMLRFRERPLEKANIELNEGLRYMYGPAAPIERGSTIQEIIQRGRTLGLDNATLNRIESNYNTMRSSLPTQSDMNEINSKALGAVHKATAGIVGADVDKYRAEYCERLNAKFSEPLDHSDKIETAMKRGKKYGLSKTDLDDIKFFYDQDMDSGMSRPEAVERANIDIDNRLINNRHFSKHLEKMGKRYGLLDNEIDGIKNQFMGVRQSELLDFIRTEHRVPIDAEWNEINAEGLVDVHRSTAEIVGSESCNKMTVEERADHHNLGLSQKEEGKLKFALDLGDNLHARMLLEDYMGIGPRPSEFYHGIGPETKEEREKEREREDKWPLYEAATTETEGLTERIMKGLDELRKPPEKEEE